MKRCVTSQRHKKGPGRKATQVAEAVNIKQFGTWLLEICSLKTRHICSSIYFHTDKMSCITKYKGLPATRDCRPTLGWVGLGYICPVKMCHLISCLFKSVPPRRKVSSTAQHETDCVTDQLGEPLFVKPVQQLTSVNWKSPDRRQQSSQKSLHH